MRTFSKSFVIVAVLLFAVPAYCQVSFKLDSVSVKTISDYEIDWSRRLIWDEYEDMIMYGPCANVRGWLTNESDHTIYVQSCWFYPGPETKFGGHIAEISFSSSFEYKGKIYRTSNPVMMGMETINFLDRSIVHIDDPVTGNRAMGYLIKSGESVPILFKSHFFEGCDISRLKVYDKRGRYGYHKFYKSNIKEGFRLEKIAKQVVNTLQFKPELVVHLECKTIFHVPSGKYIKYNESGPLYDDEMYKVE